MSSAVNVLTNTPRISDTLRRIFSDSIFAKVKKQYDGSALVQVYRLSQGVVKQGFLDI